MADNNKGKKAGRPASYSADFFPHYSNHDGESHLRHIERKWKAPGYMIYFKLLERLGSTQHHFIEYKTEEDKADLVDQLRPAEEKTIQEILDYLISRQVLDKNLYEQGIIYSPFFVNTLSTLYSSRHCNPKIPEIDNNGNITKKKDFPFSTEKYLFSTVNVLLQNDNAANKRQAKESKVKKNNQTETESTKTASSELDNEKKLQSNNQNDPSAGGVDPVESVDRQISSNKLPPVSRTVSDTAAAAAMSVNNSKSNMVKPMYNDQGDYSCKPKANNRKFNEIYLKSPVIQFVKEDLNINKDKLVALYDTYGRDRFVLCYAEVLRKLNDSFYDEISKPSGLFIASLKKEYKISETDELRSIINEIEKREREVFSS